MGEFFFITTVVFVAYVIFSVTGEKRPGTHADKAEPAPPTDKKSTPEPEAVASSATAEPPAKAVSPTIAVNPEPVATSKTIEPPVEPIKPAAPVTKKPKTGKPEKSHLKNPKTGELVRVPGNYAFAQRWIKEALVEEGLLDKVYKNNELDDESITKTHDAIQQLKRLDKYK